MISFIVVEDEEVFQNKIKKIISKLSFKIDEDINIKCFTHYDEKLRNEIKNLQNKKVYILDISLKTNISGIEIAEKIRKYDWDSEIVFVTSHDKMFELAYRSTYNIFSFREKFHKFEERFEEDIKKIVDKDFDNKMFKYNGRNTHLSIFFRTILYIYRETTERKLCIVTDTNKFIVSLSLTEMLSQLDNRFKLCHRASIVNVDRIEKIDYKTSEITFDNGKVSSYISKKYKKDIEL